MRNTKIITKQWDVIMTSQWVIFRHHKSLSYHMGLYYIMAFDDTCNIKDKIHFKILIFLVYMTLK